MAPVLPQVQVPLSTPVRPLELESAAEVPPLSPRRQRSCGESASTAAEYDVAKEAAAARRLTGLAAVTLKAAWAGPVAAPTTMAATATVAATRRDRTKRRASPERPSWSSPLLSSGLREPGSTVTVHQ